MFTRRRGKLRGKSDRVWKDGKSYGRFIPEKKLGQREKKWE